jgi:hypothetical protein
MLKKKGTIELLEYIDILENSYYNLEELVINLHETVKKINYTTI